MTDAHNSQTLTAKIIAEQIQQGTPDSPTYWLPDEPSAVKVLLDVMQTVHRFLELRSHLRHVKEFCHFAYYILDACEFSSYPEATLKKLQGQLAQYDIVYLAPYEPIVKEFAAGPNPTEVCKSAKKCASLLHDLRHDMRVLRKQLEAEKPIAAQCEPEQYSLKNRMNCFATLFKQLGDNCDRAANDVRKCVISSPSERKAES